MGADLIGYLVVGPEAINLGEADFVSYFDRHKTRREDAEPGEPEVIIPEDLDQWPADEDGLEREAFVKACMDFIDFWNNGGARDACFRKLPRSRNRMVAFAGDMSWGDSPDGWGYQSFDFVAKYDLWKLFGLD